MQAVGETLFDVIYLSTVITIVLSFAFYIPVVLWADAYPLIGLLMMPKTCAYVWTVLIGYRSMKKTSGRRIEMMGFFCADNSHDRITYKS